MKLRINIDGRTYIASTTPDRVSRYTEINIGDILGIDGLGHLGATLFTVLSVHSGTKFTPAFVSAEPGSAIRVYSNRTAEIIFIEWYGIPLASCFFPTEQELVTYVEQKIGI